MFFGEVKCCLQATGKSIRGPKVVLGSAYVFERQLFFFVVPQENWPGAVHMKSRAWEILRMKPRPEVTKKKKQQKFGEDVAPSTEPRINTETIITKFHATVAPSMVSEDAANGIALLALEFQTTHLKCIGQKCDAKDKDEKKKKGPLRGDNVLPTNIPSQVPSPVCVELVRESFAWEQVLDKEQISLKMDRQKTKNFDFTKIEGEVVVFYIL